MGQVGQVLNNFDTQTQMLKPLARPTQNQWVKELFFRSSYLKLFFLSSLIYKYILKWMDGWIHTYMILGYMDEWIYTGWVWVFFRWVIEWYPNDPKESNLKIFKPNPFEFPKSYPNPIFLVGSGRVRITTDLVDTLI